MLESLFKNVTDLKACNLIKKRLQRSCLTANIVNFFRTALFIAASGTRSEKLITSLEAVVQWSSVKKVFLEISQNSQENTCARVTF